MQNRQNPQTQRQAGHNGGKGGSHGQPESGKNGAGGSPAGGITAPYNFVSLSPWVHIPEWSAAVSHDVPFEEGLCGELTLSITAETPVLIGSEKASGSNAVDPYMLADGRYAIPGASLKGMVRNVLEIATFGRMSALDDQQFALRDLSGPTRNDYQKKFAKETSALDKDGDRKTAYVAPPETGWLTYQDDTWTITPCAMARVDHAVLDKLLQAKDAPKDSKGPFRQIAEASSTDKEGANNEADLKLPIVKYRRFVEEIAKKLGKESTWKWVQVRCEMDAKPLAHPIAMRSISTTGALPGWVTVVQAATWYSRASPDRKNTWSSSFLTTARRARRK